MIIDCHGHYTTLPPQHGAWRKQQIAALQDGLAPPPRPFISDEEIRDSIENGQLRVQRERGTDLTIFSPRAAGMGHHLAGAELLAKVIPVENILFASETIGAVQGIDPRTGLHYDDTRRYIDAIEWLSDADRQRIYEDNARSVYARLPRQLDRRFAARGATV
ncbi:hypothetical protein BH160DRAFT_2030 [Burkholderia sp. H160]|nr:hypothetical protein BH160DRAFT_2030 [Burkholderia sp. H160]